MWAYLHIGGGGYLFSYHLFRDLKVTTLLALMSQLPSGKWDESKPFLKNTSACRKKKKDDSRPFFASCNNQTIS